jgi:hypothetical protein
VISWPFFSRHVPTKWYTRPLSTLPTGVPLKRIRIVSVARTGRPAAFVTRTVTGHFAFARGWCVGAVIVTRTGDGRGALVATPAVNGCFAV